MLARYIYWNPDGNLSCIFFGRKNIKMEPGIKGCRRGTGTEKKGCFAHVVNVWHVEHVGIAKYHRHQKGVIDIRYVSS